MKYSEKELCLIWLDSFLGLEYKHKLYLYKLLSEKKGIKSLLQSGKEYIVKNIGENAYATITNSANENYFKFVLDGLNKRNIVAVTISSDNYPEEFKNTALPPLVIYAKGDVSLLNTEKFSVVGSRRTLPLSVGITKNFVSCLSKSGFTMITGIAEGIDETVIKTTLEAKGKIISVIAGGFDNIYPKSNENLVDEISERGLVITEHPPEVKPMAYMFPIRNRLIASLGKGTLIVSGRLKSGTMHTASYAVEYGKDLFAVPYSVGIESGVGCNDLIKKGAMLADSPEDILNFYDKKPEEVAVPLTAEEKKIVEILSEGEMHVEKIAEKANKEVYEITAMLSVLEIKSVVCRNGINVYGLIRKNLEE